jgi:hypothetical protein
MGFEAECSFCGNWTNAKVKEAYTVCVGCHTPYCKECNKFHIEECDEEEDMEYVRQQRFIQSRLVP